MKRLVIIVPLLLSSCRTTFFQRSDRPAWQHIEAPHPIGLQAHSSCGSGDGKMLAFGGIEAESDPPFNNRLVIYDPDNSRWESSKDALGPTPRNAASFLAFDHRILVFGGETPQKEAQADAYLYDVEKSQWEKNSEAAMFTSRKQATLSPVGDSIVLFGGKGSVPPQDWGLYSIKSRHWEKRNADAGMEARVSHIAVPLSDSELLIWGGFIDEKRRGDGFILSTQKRPLVPIPATPLLSARANARAIRIEDEVFIWGGATDDGNYNSGAVFHIPSRQWQALPSIPDARFASLKGSELGFLPNKGFILLGGRFGSDAFNDRIWLFDLKKRQWTPLETKGSFPGRIAHCVTQLSAQKWAVFGGIGYEEGTTSLTHFDGLWLLETYAP